MKALKFEGVNITFGKNQEEYDNLPAKLTKGLYGKVVFLWELSKNEKKQVSENGIIWLTVLTFNQPPQIIWPSAIEPSILKEPSKLKRGKDGKVSLLFEISDDEKKQIVESGQIWVTNLTFNQPLQPLYDSIFEPILEVPKTMHKGLKLIKK